MTEWGKKLVKLLGARIFYITAYPMIIARLALDGFSMFQ